jgi:pyruvate dehydrogenase E1 component alpha subunit
MPSRKVDGNVVGTVVAAARDAIEHARTTPGPVFLEMQTYRQLGHSKSDPARYRPAEQHEAWMARDPIELEKARLAGELGVSADALAELEADVQRELDEAIERALAAPANTPETDRPTEYAA